MSNTKTSVIKEHMLRLKLKNGSSINFFSPESIEEAKSIPHSKPEFNMLDQITEFTQEMFDFLLKRSHSHVSGVGESDPDDGDDNS